MSMGEPSHWFGGHNSWLIFVGVTAVLVVVLIPFLLFTLYKYCGFRFQFQKINSILAKLLIVNKTTESIPPTLAQPMNDFGELTHKMLDLKIPTTGIDSHGFYSDMLLTDKTDSLDI